MAMSEGGISTKEYSIASLLLPVSVAIGVRSVAAMYADFFAERVELNSIVYSFQQLKDGIAIIDDGLDPFETKNMHFPPLTLHAFRWLLNNFPYLVLPLFILLDVLTAWMVSQAAKAVWRLKKNEEETEKLSVLVFSLYAFNPISIVSTGILSLTVLQNFALAALFLSFVSDRPSVSAIIIGAWSSFTMYPIVLIFCLAFRSNGSCTRFLYFVALAVFTACAFLATNVALNEGNLNFVNGAYLSLLNFSSIQPNIGLYWYFFVQIFEHFRSFYAISFVVLFFFMPIPITLFMRKDPILHFTIIGLLTSVFFPYPTLNQISVILAILPLHEDYKKHLRYSLLIAGTLVSTVFLMPVMWHMWMVSSSGNANFFFGATIIYNVALIYLVMDMMFVYSRKQIDLEYGHSDKKTRKMEFAFY